MTASCRTALAAVLSWALTGLASAQTTATAPVRPPPYRSPGGIEIVRGVSDNYYVDAGRRIIATIVDQCAAERALVARHPQTMIFEGMNADTIATSNVVGVEALAAENARAHSIPMYMYIACLYRARAAQLRAGAEPVPPPEPGR